MDHDAHQNSSPPIGETAARVNPNHGMASSKTSEKNATSTSAEQTGLTTRTRWLLLLILGLGAAARFFNLNWDQGTGQHPDERHVMMCTWRLDWPKSLAEYFDESISPLNPRNREAHFYAYGTLPGTLLRGVVKLGGMTRPEQMATASRVLSATADTVVIALVFALGWMLHRRSRVALLAALLYALAVLPIQQAHFFVVDPFANLFVALALVLLARAWRSGKLRDYAATGVSLGLALSCKISVATFGLPVALVSLLPMAGANRGVVATLWRGAWRTLVFSLATVVTVRLALPDAFSGFWPWQLAPRWVANMREVMDISTGVTDIVFTRQFYGRIPLLWPWWNMVAWGLGLALGLTAWIGWLSAAWQVVGKRVWAHAIPLIWVGTVFFHLGFTYQATLRYFLPIYGCLCVLAAWLLARIASVDTTQALEGASSRWRAFAGKAVATVVVMFTLAWALAFLSIYTKPYTRYEASRWIYDHIPRGSVLACEHWDDWLPLPLPGDRSPGQYHQIELPLYVADDAVKRGDLLAKLNNADYIVIASQKLRDSIPRMPHRYPFTISYYEGLEDGSLGFDRVADFHRTMNFLGRPISTRSAEEAFSVYDHPPVTIYRKSSRYDPEALVRRFNAIPLDGVTDTREPVKPQPRALPNAKRGAKETGRPESAIMLSPERWAAAQQQGTWAAMFDRTSFAARFPVIVWVLQLIALQLAGWALLGPLLRALPDRGAALARPFGLLIPCWVLWLLASTGLARNDRGVYWLVFAAFSLAGASVSWWKRRDWQEWWREGTGRMAALRVEGVFWIAFAFFLLVRAGNPDLWHASWGGEKPMEMTFLYGVLKSAEFPPLNPWFAGGFINYYYFGFVLCGTLIKGLGVLPEVGFNLCLATFFGLACAATMSAARALRPAGGWLAAWSATGFVMVLGNLFQLRFIWNQLVRLGQPDHELTFPVVSDAVRAVYGLGRVMHGTALSAYAADLYWVSARAIGDEGVAPVTEFPYWSFLYGDLHPHLIALSYTLCVIALLVAWARTPDWRGRAGLTALLGLTLGFFWPTNAWDWPTYGALTGLVIFLTSWQCAGSTWRGFPWALAKSVAIFSVILGIGFLAFRPFHHSYVAGYGAFRRWDDHRTSLRDYLFIYGLFLFVLGSAWVVAQERREPGLARGLRLWARVARCFLGRGMGRERLRLVRLGLARPASILGALSMFSILTLVVFAMVNGSLPALLLAGIALSAVAAWERRNDPIRAIPALLTLFAFGLSLFVEFVVLVGDIGRMNTVFKFYYQVWVGFGLASAVALPGVLAAWRGWVARAKWPWMAAFGLLVGAATLYPLLGTPAKIRDRFAATVPTLDGLAFAEKAVYAMEGKEFSLQPDLHAIRWLQDQIAGSPVILEMNTDDRLYSWGSRYAIHTGLPSVVGWSWHQRQQQAGLSHNRVEERIADVRTIYRTADVELARRLMASYGVSLVVVGELERIYGTPEGLGKFPRMGLAKIYDAEGVQIYRVPEVSASARNP